MKTSSEIYTWYSDTCLQNICHLRTNIKLPWNFPCIMPKRKTVSKRDSFMIALLCSQVVQDKFFSKKICKFIVFKSCVKTNYFQVTMVGIFRPSQIYKIKEKMLNNVSDSIIHGRQKRKETKERISFNLNIKERPPLENIKCLYL